MPDQTGRGLEHLPGLWPRRHRDRTDAARFAAELPAAVARASGRGGGALRTGAAGAGGRVRGAQGLVMVAVILQLLGTMADEPLNLAPRPHR